MKTVALAGLFILCCETFAMGQQAPVTSGNELLEICEATGMASQGYCIGYVVGVIEGMKWGLASPLMQDGMDAAEANSIIESLLGFCLPEEATYGQYVDVVKAYLSRNPEKRHLSARILSQAALAEGFPC